VAKAVRAGAIGLVIELRLKEDGAAVNIAAATVKKLVCQKPSGEVVEFTAAFVSDGSDGKLKYVTLAASDIDELGDWRIAAYIDMPTFTGLSHEVSLRVK
jgi:hypothetical protein